MRLHDYQEKAVEFVGKAKGVYLALDMGMGKTITSIAAAARNGRKHTLVVAELNEIENSQNFRKEVDKHFAPDLFYVSLREQEVPGPGEVRFVCGINPDALKKLTPSEIRRFDTIVIDEATLAKNTGTARFRLVKKIAHQMDYVVLLSGTPMMNGAAEIFAPLVLLEHWLGGDGKKQSQMAFEKIFAGGNYKPTWKGTGIFWQDFRWTAKGANNLRELRWLIKERFMFLQKGETDVFKKKERKVELVPVTDAHREEYDRAWEEYMETLTARTRAMAKADASKMLENVAELQKLIENGQCMQVNSRHMAKRIVEDIKAGLYGDRRIIVWCLFIETEALIHEMLEEANITHASFENLAFWKEGDGKVLVGKIKSHAKGGNVPEASCALFADMDFVPSMNLQAENRMDRPEQTRDMIVRYYMPEDEKNVAHHVQKLVRGKMRKIEEFTRPFTAEEEAEMPEKIAALEAKYPKELSLLRRAWAKKEGVDN